MTLIEIQVSSRHPDSYREAVGSKQSVEGNERLIPVVIGNNDKLTISGVNLVTMRRYTQNH